MISKYFLRTPHHTTYSVPIHPKARIQRTPCPMIRIKDHNNFKKRILWHRCALEKDIHKSNTGEFWIVKASRSVKAFPFHSTSLASSPFVDPVLSRWLLNVSLILGWADGVSAPVRASVVETPSAAEDPASSLASSKSANWG